MLGLPSVTNLNHDSLGLMKALVVSSVLSGSWLGCSSQFLAYIFSSSPTTSSYQRRHDSSSAFWMQIDHLGINTGDWLLPALKLPSVSLVNADGNLSLLQF